MGLRRQPPREHFSFVCFNSRRWSLTASSRPSVVLPTPCFTEASRALSAAALDLIILICFAKASRASCLAAGSLCPAFRSVGGNGASLAAKSRPRSHCSTCRQYTSHCVPAPPEPSAQRSVNTAFRISSCRARCKSPLSCGVSSTGWVAEKEGVRAEPASVVWVVTTWAVTVEEPAMAVVVWAVCQECLDRNMRSQGEGSRD